jgi:hypothetical protein
MQATTKNTTPRKRPTPPASINLQREEDLLPYERLERALAQVRVEEGHLGPCSHLDALNWLHHRAASLCDIVGEAALSGSGSEMPGESLATVMDILREDIRVAGWIIQKMDEPAGDRPNCPPIGPA